MKSLIAFEALERCLRDPTGNIDVAFSGKIFLFGVDFRQRLPI